MLISNQTMKEKQQENKFRERGNILAVLYLFNFLEEASGESLQINDALGKNFLSYPEFLYAS